MATRRGGEYKALEVIRYIMADTELGRELFIPPLGMVGLVVIVASLPFFFPANSDLDQCIHWGLWLLAGLGILYIAVTFRRVYEEYGLAAALKWVLRGTPPRE